MSHDAVDDLGLCPSSFRTPLEYYQARCTQEAKIKHFELGRQSGKSPLLGALAKEDCIPPLGFKNIRIHKGNIGTTENSIGTEPSRAFDEVLSDVFKKSQPKFVKDSQRVKKDRLSLLDIEYLKGTARILSFGADKYGVENWKECEDITLYKDALLRHVLAYIGGETHDPETDELHLYHASCNLMFLQWFELNKVLNNKGEVIQDKGYYDGSPDTN